MNITKHNITDKDFFIQAKRLKRYINNTYPNPTFRIRTRPAEYEKEYSPNQLFIARDSNPVGHMSVLEFKTSQETIIPWLYAISRYQLYSPNGSILEHEQLTSFEPLNDNSANGAYILVLESFQKGAGSSLISRLKDENDFILLASTKGSETFYENMGFTQTRFTQKTYDVPKPFHYWSK